MPRYLLKDTETEYSTAFVGEENPSTIILTQGEGTSLTKNVSNKTAGQLTGDGYVEIEVEEWEEQTLRVGSRPTRPSH